VAHRRILVTDDIENESILGRKCSEALRRAALALAWKLKTGIDILYVEDVNAFPLERYGFDGHRLENWHLGNKRKLEDLCMNLPVPARGILKSGSPADQIQKVIRSTSRPELVVLGTHGRKGIRRLLLGSVAEEVIRHSERPVMVIGPSAQKNLPNFKEMKPFKILVATDLSKNSRAPERYALSLAKRVSGEVVLFHSLWDKFRIIQQNALAYGMYLINLDDLLEPIRKDATERLEKMAVYFKDHGVTTTFRIESDSIPSEEVILKETEKNYSIVIMGTHGRNILLNGFLGSTSRGIILNSKIPVIIVHSNR